MQADRNGVLITALVRAIGVQQCRWPLVSIGVRIFSPMEHRAEVVPATRQWYEAAVESDWRSPCLARLTSWKPKTNRVRFSRIGGLDTKEATSMRRYLVVANQTLGGAELAAKLDELSRDQQCRFYMVVPITQMSGSDHAVDAAWAPLEVHDGYQVGHKLAEGRLNAELARLRKAGVEADGEVVDPLPIDRVRELAGREDYDAIIVSTLPHRMSRWLRIDLPHRLKKATQLPLDHVISSAGPSL